MNDCGLPSRRATSVWVRPTAKRHIEWKAKSAIRRDVLEPVIRAAIAYDPTT